MFTSISQKDLNKAFRLRHTIFCEKMGIWPTNRNLVEVDAYDAMLSTYHRLTSGGAYVRIITGPFKPYLDYGTLPAGVKAGEISRLCHEPGLSRAQTKINMLKLFVFVSWIFYTRNVKVICGMVEPGLLPVLKKHYGVEFSHVGEPVDYFGTRVPVWEYRGVMFKKWFKFNWKRLWPGRL